MDQRPPSTAYRTGRLENFFLFLGG
uniref:Uncharacterized protein n=1 Tax=Rhizophora mucronata TaxID=61149 RepID=A0A2P2LZR8_RHIMU